MMEEKKDIQLQKEFGEYFDAVEAPKINLDGAKAELERTRERRKRGKRIATLLSACATVALVLALTFTILPMMFRAEAGKDSDKNMSEAPPQSDNSSPAPDLPDPDIGGENNAPQDPSDSAEGKETVYSLSAAEAEEKSYAQLKGTFGSRMSVFDKVEEEETIECRYRLYVYGGVAVMIGADITAAGDAAFTATVYVDLSGGRYSAKELAEYRELPQGEDCAFSTGQTEGEYRSRVYWKNNGEKFADVRSFSEQGLQEFFGYFFQ